MLAAEMAMVDETPSEHQHEISYANMPCLQVNHVRMIMSGFI